MPSVFENLAIPRGGEAVTPHASNNFTKQGIVYVGGAGNVALVTANGDVLTFVGVPAGTFLPVQAMRVNAVNTTATSMLVVY